MKIIKKKRKDINKKERKIKQNKEKKLVIRRESGERREREKKQKQNNFSGNEGFGKEHKMAVRDKVISALP